MSKQSNVNPDHYKIAGRGRQGEDVVPELEKQRLAREEQDARRRRSRPRAIPEAGGAETAPAAAASERKPGKARE